MRRAEDAPFSDDRGIRGVTERYGHPFGYKMATEEGRPHPAGRAARLAGVPLGLLDQRPAAFRIPRGRSRQGRRHHARVLVNDGRPIERLDPSQSNRVGADVVQTRRRMMFRARVPQRQGST